jgi:hypothetical protein
MSDEENEGASGFRHPRRYVSRSDIFCDFSDYLALERTDYHTGNDLKNIARTDPIQRFPLLSLNVRNNAAEPTLPITSEYPDAFESSPFYDTMTAQDYPSDAAPPMADGRWTFQRELALPTSLTQVHPSNKNPTAHILITHTIKVIFRVERGDDEFIDRRTGKRKLFDVIVRIPVNILSVCFDFISHISSG